MGKYYTDCGGGVCTSVGAQCDACRDYRVTRRSRFRSWMIRDHPRIFYTLFYLRLIQQNYPGEYNNAIARRYSPTEDR